MSWTRDDAIAKTIEFSRDAVLLSTENGRGLFGFPALPLIFVFDKPDATPLDLAERIIELSLIEKLQDELAILMTATPRGAVQ